MESPEFLIELEFDPIKNNELGGSFSKPDQHFSETGRSITSLEVGGEKSSRSYLSIVPSTIQVIKANHTLFVWHTNFHPGVGRRFQNAVITFKFSPAEAKAVNSNESQPQPLNIVTHAPRKAFGGSSNESRTVHWGMELPITITAGVAQAGPIPSISQETAKEVEHAFTITGTKRGVPQTTTCVWTVEENTSSERGIPSEIQLAALVRHTAPVACQVSVSAQTAGGLLPPHHLKTKTPLEHRRREMDPSQYAGLLHEYDFGPDPSNCDRLLESWTGEVRGALLEFAQAVVRS
jgi:hypothetical protein